MTEQELKKLERQAFDGSINLDNLPAPEYRYFDRIRRLYEKYKFDKNMPKDFTERMKRIAFSEYMQDIEDRKRYTSMYAQYQYNIKQADKLKIEAEKADTIYHIACCTADIVGMLTGDEGYGKRIREKIGGMDKC